MPQTTQRPNIVILYADDLGFGDIGCYGGTGIPTPNLDRLGAGSIRFTEGHATAATCTPSRFSLLTGTYPWRNKRAQILAGDAPAIIEPGACTLPSMLKQAGYRTGVVGKWHLGLGDGKLDWNQEIRPSPLDVGFDSSFIMAATNDRVPCVYVEGRRVANLDPADPLEVTYDREKAFPGLPTGKDNPELLTMRHSHGHDMSIINGVGRIGFMRGGASAVWKDDEMAEVFLGRAVSFVEQSRDKPFFLYYALHQPHCPRIPGKKFAGSTQLGPRGDVIAEMDWCVGEFLKTLDRLGLRENTIVVFSSDNGPVLDDGYVDQAVERCGSHRPAGPLRGGKYSLYDGGTRVPFLLSWPGTVTPGESDALVCHMDFLASFAALVGQDLPVDGGLDSLNLLSALLGQNRAGRDELVTEGTQKRLAIRQNEWVCIPPHAGVAVAKFTNIEMGNSPDPQLYRMTRDLGQKENCAKAHEDRVRSMSRRLQEVLASARTRSA
jgi:arylsulfatase A-like enzyme